MRKVIYVGEEPKEEKGVEFTHYFNSSQGFVPSKSKPSDFDKIAYLGKCINNGELFAAYGDGGISIYKGHLNNGTF